MHCLVRCSGLALLTAALALHTGASAAERRVALVIGNSAYQHTAVLPNPRNDAQDLVVALNRLGFDAVSVGLDLDKRGMERKVREFTGELATADVALFFYAGHALQVGDRNYLLPVDARLASERDLDFETISASLVVQHMGMDREGKTSIVLLDACRDNPLAKNLVRTMGTRSSSVQQGLAELKGGRGTLIGFSTQPGNVARDGQGRNSPYAQALLKYMESTDGDIHAVLIHVRNQVLESTSGYQVPWESSSLTRQFHFRRVAVTAPTAALPAAAPAPAAPRPGASEEAIAWAMTKDTTSIPVLEAFLNRYPSGIYADMARARAGELRQMRTDQQNTASREREAAESELRQKQAREAGEREARARETREREAREREAREREARDKRIAIAPQAVPPGATAPLGRPEAFGIISAWVERDFLKDNIAYAATVDWYDQGAISREAVLKDRAKYLERWPERTFTLIVGSIQITTSGPNRYAVTFEHTYAVRSPPRKAQGAGKSRIMLDVEMIDGIPHVARQKEITGK